jgi:hypothetical protein
MPSPTLGPEAKYGEDETVEAKAKHILRQSDGVAIMRRYQDVPTDRGKKYFEDLLLVDERRFLHDESGASAVIPDEPVFDLPALQVDVWRELALGMGGVEYGELVT